MRKIVLLAAVAAAAVVSAVAVSAASGGDAQKAVLPKAGTLLGGGRMGVPGSANFEALLAPTTLAVRRTKGTDLRVYGDWNAPCAGGGGITAVFAVDTTIKANGTFSGAGTVDGAEPGSTVTVSGRFTSPTSAAGSGRARFTFMEGTNARRCDTGNVTFQVRANAPVTGKPSWKANAQYYGNTSQTLPVIARVTPDGKKIQVVLMPEMLCTSKVKFVPGANISPIGVIKPDGTFRITEVFDSNRVGPDREGSGKVAATGTGTFFAGGIKGTWTFQQDIVLSDGTKDTCRAKATYSARL